MTSELGAPHDRRRTRTLVLIGGGVLLLTVAGAAIVVTANWPRISALVRRASVSYSQLARVRAAIQERYKPEQVLVMGHFGEPATMSINLINPPFWETIAGDPDSPATKSQALEVAIVARDALLARSDYDIFQVILTRRHGGAVAVSKYHGFVFRADELPLVVPR